MNVSFSSNAAGSSSVPVAGNLRSDQRKASAALRHLVRRALYSERPSHPVERQIREFAGTDFPLIDCSDSNDRAEYVEFVATQLERRMSPWREPAARANERRD